MSFSEVEDLYQQIVLDRSRHPHHMRVLEPFDARADGDNPMCGDRIEVRIAFAPDGGIGDVGFQARGCAISLASADLMAESVRGRSPQAAHALAEKFRALARTGDTDCDDPAMENLRALSGVSEYPSRIKCATLPWAALTAALDGGKEASRE